VDPLKVVVPGCFYHLDWSVWVIYCFSSFVIWIYVNIDCGETRYHELIVHVGAKSLDFWVEALE